jgi:hypothetical protein
MKNGRKISQETKAKMSESMKIAWLHRSHEVSEETRKKISTSVTGLKRSEETCAKISIARTGMHFTEEHKANLKKARGHTKRYELTDDIRFKISESNKGKIYSEETRRKIGDKSKGRIPTPEQRMKMSTSIRKENHPNWQGGKSFEPYCQKFDRYFKEQVRAYFGYVCPECGTPQNGRKLAVHHVNFKKDACCNQSVPKLFIPLCNGEKGIESCHSKTNWNRDYWEQHFTDMIMAYYQGKCYFTPEEMEAYNGVIKCATL